MQSQKKKFVIFAVMAAVLAGPLLASDMSWPQFRGPRGDGVSLERSFLKDWPSEGPATAWRIALGEGFSGVSAVGDRLYTMYAKGTDEFVICLDAADGKEIWKQRVGEKWVDRFGHGPRATPVVADGAVYALGGNGNLAAFSAADGTPRWSHDLQKEYAATPPRWGVSTAPIVEDGNVLVNVGGGKGAQIVAFKAADGVEAWRSHSGRAGYAAPISILVGDIRQVLFFTAKELVALRPANGSVLWSLPWETSYDVNAASPVFIAPDRVFLSSGYDVGAVMLRLKVSDGNVAVEELWRSREMKNQFSSSVHRDGLIYGFDDKTLKCIDVNSGEMKWGKRGFGHGSLFWADGHLVVLGDRGQLALAAATAEAYRERAAFQVFDTKTWTVPTLVSGRLYIRDEKELIALDVAVQEKP